VHDQVEALSIADQVAVIRGGRLVQTADPSTLYRTPVDAEVARSVGDALLLPGHLTGYIRCPLGRLPVHDPTGTSGPATAMIRPEQLVLNSEPAAPTGSVVPNAERAAPTGHVVDITYYGHDATVHLDVGSGGYALRARVPGFGLPAIGERVTIVVCGDVVVFRENPDGLAWRSAQQLAA
jgi:iron(III) transport system ATP-binding protein